MGYEVRNITYRKDVDRKLRNEWRRKIYFYFELSRDFFGSYEYEKGKWLLLGVIKNYNGVKFEREKLIYDGNTI